MQRALRSFLVAAALGSLVVFPATAHAQRAAAQIVGLYMTTEQAYNAYGNYSPAPPRVDAFPQGVAIVGVYLHYRGVKPHKTTYRVGFRRNGAEVRHGVLHTFDYVAGETVLSIPADEMQARGAYRATLYVDGVATLTTNFTVIRTPTIDKAYMITAKAWDAYDPNGKSDPPKATGFPAGVARVGAFFSYSGMVKTDLHYVAVYDTMRSAIWSTAARTTMLRAMCRTVASPSSCPPIRDTTPRGSTGPICMSTAPW
jgi:hypothetical protein